MLEAERNKRIAQMQSGFARRLMQKQLSQVTRPLLLLSLATTTAIIHYYCEYYHCSLRPPDAESSSCLTARPAQALNSWALLAVTLSSLPTVTDRY